MCPEQGANVRPQNCSHMHYHSTNLASLALDCLQLALSKNLLPQDTGIFDIQVITIYLPEVSLKTPFRTSWLRVFPQGHSRTHICVCSILTFNGVHWMMTERKVWMDDDWRKVQTDEDDGWWMRVVAGVCWSVSEMWMHGKCMYKNLPCFCVHNECMHRNTSVKEAS